MGDFDYSVRKQGNESKPFTGYACKDITVSGSSVDYSLRENTTFFSRVSQPIQILIRNGSQDVTFKFNSVSNDPIPLIADAVWGTDNLIISDIFVTVSGSSDASFNVYCQGWR